MAFFEDSHMREPYPRDPRILFKPWYHLWQRFFWSSCVFSNFCFKWSPVKHYKSALLVDNFFQSDDFLEDFSCGNWNSNEIGKLYSSPNHHHQKIRGNHKFFAVSFPIWTLSKGRVIFNFWVIPLRFLHPKKNLTIFKVQTKFSSL